MGARGHPFGRSEAHGAASLCSQRQINARALPVLVQETLTAQSADGDSVSGATVTSEGYVESLQGALDQAGL